MQAMPPLPPVQASPLRPVEPGADASKVKVALLVPLSGSNAALGQAMLDAAQLAVFEVSAPNFDLLPRDTQGTPEGARAAATAALADGAKLILGPVFAADVAAVRPVAAAANVNIIAFSTDWTTAGGNVFLMGFTPFRQVERVVSYTRAQGITRFGVLAPSTPYGNVVVDSMSQAAGRYGAEVTRVGRYAPDQDIAPAVQAFAADPSYQAVMLPDGGPTLARVAQALPFQRGQVRLLGTGLWDDPNVGREPALVGGWFAAPSPEARMAFERRFQTAYGRQPPRIASLAYDAAALAAVLAKVPSRQGPAYDAQTLRNPSGFAGIDGIFRFRQDGLAERGLAVLEVTQGGARVVDPAPETFQAVTF
jgi:branched-chain amino acid transport system substrate-binding protein